MLTTKASARRSLRQGSSEEYILGNRFIGGRYTAPPPEKTRAALEMVRKWVTAPQSKGSAPGVCPGSLRDIAAQGGISRSYAHKLSQIVRAEVFEGRAAASEWRKSAGEDALPVGVGLEMLDPDWSAVVTSGQADIHPYKEADHDPFQAGYDDFWMKKALPERASDNYRLGWELAQREAITGPDGDEP